MGDAGQQSGVATADTESPSQEPDSHNGTSFFARPSSSWTDTIPKTEHNALFLECDYGPTTLGPIANWGPALRLYASMVFADSRSSGVYWGPNRIVFYNEKFGVICGEAHPFHMGRGLQEAFPTVWEQINPVLNEAEKTGQTVDVENILLFMIRRGFLEEAYFIGQFIPLRGDSGEIEGFYNTVYESTARVLHERRRLVVEHVAAIPPLSVDDTLKRIVDALRYNPKDITMAMLYSSDALVFDGNSDVHLQGSIGIPDGHPCAPAEAHLRTSEEGVVPLLRQVKARGKLLVLSDSDGSLKPYEELFAGIDWCGYGEASRTIVIVPLSLSGSITGFYVQGTNPRGVYDEAAEMSIIDATRQIEAKWISSMSSEQAKIREQVLEQRALDSEGRLRHMALYAPLGMCQIGPDHKLQWANEQYYEITGHDRHNPDMAAFRQNLPEEERESALNSLKDLLNGKARLTREVRLDRKWKPPSEECKSAEEDSAWMLITSFPLMEDGKVKLIMGYVTDISPQKWAESVQKNNAGAAVLAKQRQEAFIDTTSHEMRNPLTAITQLANGIAESLQGDNEHTIEAYRTIAEESADAASTILACAAHQRRVIDDVLILSRLESHMLSIHPVAEQPSRLVESTVKMFDGEVATSGITIEAVKHRSPDDLQVKHVLIDTSRLAQVLINLISNAIKFTASQKVRKLSVSYGVQRHRPPEVVSAYGDLAWVTPTDPEGSNTALPPSNSDEDRLYLYFCVQDTGSGVSAEAMNKLFKRFSQATAKTHVEFGGSGLGLYICRQLAENQGGGVGVVSKIGEGSAFGFYVETRAMLELHQDTKKHGPAANHQSRAVHSGQDAPRWATSKSEPNLRTDLVAGVPKPLSLPLRERKDIEPKSYHALLVEDNLINQKVLAKQLRKSGWTVTVANNGVEALAVLKTADCWRQADHNGPAVPESEPEPLPIAVILMDLEMPVMNGLECCACIRSLELEGQITKHLPIIAITANVRQEQKDEAVAAGMDRVVSKPFTVSELTETVLEVIDGRE